VRGQEGDARVDEQRRQCLCVSRGTGIADLLLGAHDHLGQAPNATLGRRDQVVGVRECVAGAQDQRAHV